MELKWDLSQIYKTRDDFNADFDELKILSDQILNFKGKLNDKTSLLEYFRLSEEIAQIKDKMTSYLFFIKSLDGSDVFALEQFSLLENFFEQQNLKTTFVMQEIKKISNDKLMEWAKLPEFKNYDNELKDIVKIKKHTLSTSQEKLMIGSSYAFSASDIFDCIDNVEINFGKTKDENGKIVKLTNANLHNLASSNIKQVRKQAICKVFKAYKALNQTISANFISHLKYSNFVAKTYKYKNTLDMCLKGDDLPSGLPQKVVKYVNDYLPLLHRYYAWRKQFMNLDKFESCDLSCNLFSKQIQKEYSLEEGIKIVKKAVEPIGEKYAKMVDFAVENKWIDSVFLPNKDSGAYSLSLFGVHPFVLMTYDNTQNSVSTLAHELGHAINGYYTHKSQPYTKSENPIFVAEVASTVNEILLADYFINNSKTPQEKIGHITQFLGTFMATVFTQTEYTEFELYVHNCVDKGVPLNYKLMNDYYLKLQKKYCGKDVSVLPLSQYHWSRIPHFYSNFYVFKYVTGFISACAIVQKLKTQKNYNKKYIEFLQAGSSSDPCDILKIADVDILQKATFDQSFKLFEDYLNQLMSLSK